MSSATKKKYVYNEVLYADVRPSDGQEIVEIIESRGNFLFAVRNAAGEGSIASMPNKFRKTIWVKVGDLVIVEPIPEGDRVTSEIVRILTRRQVKEAIDRGLWPPKETAVPQAADDDSDDEYEFINRNRPPPIQLESSDSSDDSMF